MDRDRFIKHATEVFHSEVLNGSDNFRDAVFEVFEVSTSQDAKNTFVALIEGNCFGLYYNL